VKSRRKLNPRAPACPACKKLLVHHDGLFATCRDLQLARQSELALLVDADELRKLRAFYFLTALSVLPHNAKISVKSVLRELGRISARRKP
jgi:hypothetical protein